jgi:hypothetical protein
MTEKLPFKVGLVPYELRHERNLAAIALSEMDWPRQDPPSKGCIGDLAPEDHIVVYPSSTRVLRNLGPLVCKVDLIMAEPLAIQGRYYKNLWVLRHKFNSIYCRYRAYASRYSNVHQLPIVESWVDGNLIDYRAPKSKLCSIIVSTKKDLPGHELRHAVVDWSRSCGIDISVLGHGYQPFELKQEGLVPYYYSVVIENVQETDYFTEKLLDCMLCGSMPIYWGAPNIGEYFDPSGMHICLTYDDLVNAITLLGSAPKSTPTSDQRIAMDINRERALSLSQLKPRIVDAVYTHGS